MSVVDEIKAIVKEGKAVIGTGQVFQQMKLGKIAKVFVTVNCPDGVKEDIRTYAQLGDVEVVQLKQPNDELGVLCKKPFSISVLGLRKGA